MNIQHRVHFGKYNIRVSAYYYNKFNKAKGTPDYDKVCERIIKKYMKNDNTVQKATA